MTRQRSSEYQFLLSLSQEEYLRYYSGDVHAVQVKSLEGLTIQFPASALKSWVTHNGIHGQFVIRFDENNKLIELNKLAELRHF